MTRKERAYLKALKNYQKQNHLNDKGKDHLIMLLIAREHELKRQVDEYEA